MHDQIFANQKAMEPKNLSEYAKAIGMDVSKFQHCFDSGKYTEVIKKNRIEGQKAGATGAPGFFLGYTDPAKPGTVKAIKMIKGAQPYSKFKEAIDSLLLLQK
jgi:predicted DsbA family dithiol-disulfide isomerase